MNIFRVSLLRGIAVSAFAVLLVGSAELACSVELLAESTSPSGTASWTTTVSHGDTVKQEDGGLTFKALPNTRADIRRPVDRDLITTTAKVSGWGSIYLVWNPNTWCAIGQISPTPFARIYSTAVLNGKVEQVQHRGIHIGDFHWIRIRLGANYVSFAYSNNGEQWITLRTIKRPTELLGAPRLMVAGKYYAASEDAFGTGDLSPVKKVQVEEVNGLTHSDLTDGRIEALNVAETPAGQVKLTEKELAIAIAPPVEPVMALLKNSKSDPTYEEVAKFYPPMKYPREVVGVPLHPRDIGVDYLGRIDESSYVPLAWFEVGNPSEPLGSATRPFERRLLNGYVPVDMLKTTIKGVEYEITIFGWSEEFSVTKPLYAYLQLSAKSVGGKLPKVVSFVSPEKKILTWELSSENKASARVSVKLQFPTPTTAVKVPEEEFASRMNSVANLWERKLLPATRFDIPDKRVMDAYRAWLAYSMLDTDTVNGYPEPHDGSGFYETMFGNSVSEYSTMLDEYGLHDYSAQVLGTQIHFQHADGLYTAECGLVDPGAFLIGLAEHYRVTGDKHWLESVAPAMLKQAKWIMRERDATPKSGMTRGLIKYRPYNDYVMPTFNYFGNVKCALGLLDAGEVLDAIGMPEGKELMDAAKKYRADILSSMNAAAFSVNGQTLLPVEPDTHRLLKLEDYNAGGYYGLTASPLLATEFLAPQDHRAVWLVDALEKRGGLLAGLAEFNRGMDHAYTYGYLLNELKLGEARKTILGFWSMLAYGMTRTTYSPVEVTMFKTGENELTLPHLFSCTQQLLLLRSMLLRKDGDNLEIGEGIPRQWLAPGRHVAVDSASTEFGDISYRISISPDGIGHLRIVPPSRTTPKEIVVHLRTLNGGAIKSVQKPSQTEVTYAGDSISFANLSHSVEVEVRFKGANNTSH